MEQASKFGAEGLETSTMTLRSSSSVSSTSASVSAHRVRRLCRLFWPSFFRETKKIQNSLKTPWNKFN